LIDHASVLAYIEALPERDIDKEASRVPASKAPKVTTPRRRRRKEALQPA
jgi:hypothetical protein